MRTDINVGDIVQHFKRETLSNPGNLYLYKILAFAEHTETKEMLVICEPPMTKITGFPFFRNRTPFLTIRVISQLEGMTPLSHRNIPKIRKSLNTST